MAANRSRFEERRIIDEFDIPMHRPAAPDRHETRGVERIDHQNDDRQIQEGDAEDDRREIECGNLAHL
jgi:hypothetical protein